MDDDCRRWEKMTMMEVVQAMMEWLLLDLDGAHDRGHDIEEEEEEGGKDYMADRHCCSVQQGWETHVVTANAPCWVDRDLSTRSAAGAGEDSNIQKRLDDDDADDDGTTRTNDSDGAWDEKLTMMEVEEQYDAYCYHPDWKTA